MLKAMGFRIDFYCDNNKKENQVIRDEITTISLEKLYSLKDEVLVFVTLASRHQLAVKEQLEEKGIHNIVRMDFQFLQTFIESVLEMDEPGINEQFKCILDDAEYVSRQFKYYMGYSLDLNNPQTFNEKLQWLKLYDRKQEYTQMVDKLEAKKYVADKIGEEYIIPTLGVYDTFDEIKFEKLPQQFVLKCTHDSGSIVICKDKKSFNKREARNILENALKRNFYWQCREWPYKNVKPRIIVEKRMMDESNCELKDYKIFNFNGKAKFIQVDYDRFKQHKRNLYTTDWEYMEASIEYPNDAQRKIERPQELEKMIALAEVLSEGIPHLRTDFYSIRGKIYFGELTFYHGAGYEKFTPENFGFELGNQLYLSNNYL